MSYTPPTVDNGYFVDPRMRLSREVFALIFGSIHQRLLDREALEATFAQLIADGTGQALATIQANVGPQIAALAAQIEALAQSAAEAEDIVAALLTSNLPANQVKETTARKFVPGIGANGSVLRVLAGALAWSSLNWGDIGGKPATFPPAAHGHSFGDVSGLDAALTALATGLAQREPAITAGGANQVILGDKTLAFISSIVPALASAAEAEAGTDAAKIMTAARVADAITARVPAAVAALAYGGVGTYAVLERASPPAPNQAYAGSTLYAGASAQSGTWRSAGAAFSSIYGTSAALYLRIV